MWLRKKKKLSNQKGRTLITQRNPRSPISEQYRAVRTDMQIASAQKEIKSLVVTSANPSEGKSLTISNLAITFAQQGKKVLLIDADLRMPTLQYTFRLDNHVGLSSVLTGEYQLHKQVIRTSDIPGLDLLPSGPVPENPSELLASDMMKKLLRVCSAHYDMVMMDTAPLLAVTDAQILANLSDGALLVTRSKKTHVESVQKAVDLLKQCRVHYLGAILNDVKQKKSDHYYYYGSK